MLFGVSKVPKSVGIQKLLTSIHIQEWLKSDVFHWRWWFLLSLIIIILIIWWACIDKSRVHEICLYVALATIIAMGIVEHGEELTLWDYPTDIIPIFPPLTSINLLILPLAYSLIYQFFKVKKNFVTATLIVTAIICFIVEPILSWIGLYKLLHWQYYYSFFIYAMMAILIRYIVIKINIITDKYRS